MGTESKVADNSAPSWLNNEFFEKALRSGEDPNIAVTSSKVTRATVVGDNYASDMYRAVLNISKGGHTEERSIIVKSSKHGDGELAKALSKSNMFEREINTMTTINPEVIRLLTEASTFEPFAAKHVHSNTNDFGSTIVLEDLKLQGFRMAQFKLGLDMKHCQLVMRKIAKYHAASAVLYRKDPGIFKPFMFSNVYNQDMKEAWSPFMKSMSKSCTKATDEWPGYKDRFANKLTDLGVTGMDKLYQAVKRDDSEFNVMTHGDLWVNNMMFRYSEDTGEVEDVRFVDFQISHWTSPTVDLQYFLNSSASPDVIQNPEVLTDQYLKVLAETLVLLGHEDLMPTEAQFNDQFENRGRFGMLVSILTRVMALADRSKIPDMDEFMKLEQEFHLSDAYKVSLKALLPYYENRKWI